MEHLDIPLLPEFRNELVEKDELHAEAKSAKKIQKIDNGIEAQRAVFELGANYWKELLNWNTGQALLAPDEENVVNLAARIPNKIPSDLQSLWLLEIRAKVEAEGFSV